MDRKTLLSALTDHFDHSFRDPVWKDIALDAGYRQLFLTPTVQKLDRIRQNGPACHIYPGAVHTRLAHSLGVYHVARNMLLRLLRDEQDALTVTGVRSFLAACLLHDIGHFPYAHSLKELSMREHEELACDLVDDDKRLNTAIKEAGADPGMVKAIINKKLPADRECLIYRHMLSGALDPDKLDYLNRDAFFAGVPYGMQDNGYVISSMRLHEDRIALEWEALSSLEHILTSKYLMYRNVYWHKAVRSATCMIKKALLMALRDGVLKMEDLYFIDDFEFDRIPSDHPGYKALSLIKRVADNQLLTRTYTKPYDKDGQLEIAAGDLFKRLDVEARIHEGLSRKHPGLEEWEVVIDIQEPVSFESDTMILTQEGPRPFKELTQLFSSDAAARFTASLRSLSVYTPSYMSTAEVQEVLDGIL